jgi:outer membrane protein insertion porin family
MKFSAGISGEWLSPFGALSVSAAYPINKGTYTYVNGFGQSITGNDQTQYFQFNFGQNF